MVYLFLQSTVKCTFAIFNRNVGNNRNVSASKKKLKNRLILPCGSLIKPGVHLRVCECKELKEKEWRFLVSMMSL